jgi:hypothetical protein
MGFTIVLLVVIIFDIVALRWGVDSREKIDSPEWERRKYFLSGHQNRQESLPEHHCIPAYSCCQEG